VLTINVKRCTTDELVSIRLDDSKRADVLANFSISAMEKSSVSCKLIHQAIDAVGIL
jgi:hypothetical protein